MDLTRELRQDEEDPLLEVLLTMSENVGVRFAFEYLSSGSIKRIESYCEVVASPRYGPHVSFPSFVTVSETLRSADPNNDENLRLAAVKLAECPI